MTFALQSIYIYIYIYIHIFILLCFNVLSTVPRENRLADFLIHIYIYIYIYIYDANEAHYSYSDLNYNYKRVFYRHSLCRVYIYIYIYDANEAHYSYSDLNCKRVLVSMSVEIGWFTGRDSCTLATSKCQSLLRLTLKLLWRTGVKSFLTASPLSQSKVLIIGREEYFMTDQSRNGGCLPTVRATGIQAD